MLIDVFYVFSPIRPVPPAQNFRVIPPHPLARIFPTVGLFPEFPTAGLGENSSSLPIHKVKDMKHKHDLYFLRPRIKVLWCTTPLLTFIIMMRVQNRNVNNGLEYYVVCTPTNRFNRRLITFYVNENYFHINNAFTPINRQYLNNSLIILHFSLK